MMTEKPTYTKHAIYSYQELMVVEHPQSELLIWHHRLGHLTVRKIKSLDLLWIISQRIANSKPSRCKGCICGCMNNIPWRTKGRQANNIQPVTTPVQCVLVDQLESPLLGFLSQLKVRLTNQQKRASTVSVGHFSRISYLYLQSNLTSEKT